ncbi:MAG: FAD-dependent oxidoreductase [Pseudomonadota bacterium]
MGQPQIVIIGAGIAGLSLAWSLTGSGHAVTVVDAGAVGAGASRAATAYLEPRLGSGGLRAIEWASAREWPALADEIEAETGQSIDYRREGLIHVATPERSGELADQAAERQRRGWNARLLEPAELSELEPNLRGEVGAALFLPDIHWLDGRRLCRALAAAIRRRGGAILEDRPVTRLVPDGGGLVAETSGDAVPASHVIVCTGAAGPQITGLPGDIPFCRPVRGVVVSVQSDPDAPLVNRVIKHRKGPVCPRSDGRILLGTTYERGETSSHVRPELAEQLVANAARFIPKLRDCPVTEVTTGIRALAPDGLIHIGRSRELPDVYYSLSHSGAGYLRAPVIAREFAEFIIDNAAGCPLTGKYLAR